jgi:chromosome segregation ATPase
MTETNYESVAADLVGRIDKLRKKITGLDQKRSIWALDAQLGDADAKAEMSKLGDQRNRLNGEIVDLEAALAEARRRANDVTNEAAAEVVRQRAEKAAVIVQRLLARGPAMDQAASIYSENFKGIQTDITELARLDVPTPSWQLVSVNMDIAHDSALSSLGSKYVEQLVPPNRRRQFDFLIKGWCTPAQNWIKKINTNTAAKDAA